VESWILQQDNALAHKAILVCQFLAGKQKLNFRHAPYLPDHALRDFFLFQKLKS